MGVLGLAFHPGFVTLTGMAYDAWFPALGASPATGILKWGLAGLMILPQSVLLGATFPLMSAGVVRRLPQSPGGTVARLYFANSLGGAAGVLASGFWLVGAVRTPWNTGGRGRSQPAGRSDGGSARQARRGACRGGDRAVAPCGDGGGESCPLARPAAPGGELRHRGGFVHLRDRLGENALAGAGERDPQLRADALGLHLGSGAGIGVDPSARRRPREPDPVPGMDPMDHGSAGTRDAAALFGLVRLDRCPGDLAQERAPGLRDLLALALRHLPGGHAPGNVLRRHHASVADPHRDDARLGRTCDRGDLRSQYPRLDPGGRARGSGPDAVARARAAAGCRSSALDMALGIALLAHASRAGTADGANRAGTAGRGDLGGGCGRPCDRTGRRRPGSNRPPSSRERPVSLRSGSYSGARAR